MPGIINLPNDCDGILIQIGIIITIIAFIVGATIGFMQSEDCARRYRYVPNFVDTSLEIVSTGIVSAAGIAIVSTFLFGIYKGIQFILI